MEDIENYFNTKFIKELSENDFDKYAVCNLKNNKITGMLLYYAPWCGYCKKVKEPFEEVAKTASLMCDFMALNCEKQKPQYIKIRDDTPELISGFPTIIIYKDGKPYEKYNDERTTEKLLKTCMRIKSAK